MEEETWLGMVGRGRKKQRQWYAVLRGQPNAETVNVTFSPGEGKFDKSIRRREKKRRIRVFKEKFRELPVEEQTDFLKDFIKELELE